MPVLLMAAFGVLGVLARFGIDKIIPADRNLQFPVSTFLINIFGSAIAGFVFVLIEKGTITPMIQNALLIGFCGGFTTFSAYSLQSIALFEKGRTLNAFLYFALSPLLALGAAYLVIFLARKI